MRSYVSKKFTSARDARELAHAKETARRLANPNPPQLEPAGRITPLAEMIAAAAPFRPAERPVATTGRVRHGKANRATDKYGRPLSPESQLPLRAPTINPEGWTSIPMPPKFTHSSEPKRQAPKIAPVEDRPGAQFLRRLEALRAANADKATDDPSRLSGTEMRRLAKSGSKLPPAPKAKSTTRTPAAPERSAKRNAQRSVAPYSSEVKAPTMSHVADILSALEKRGPVSTIAPTTPAPRAKKATTATPMPTKTATKTAPARKTAARPAPAPARRGATAVKQSTTSNYLDRLEALQSEQPMRVLYKSYDDSRKPSLNTFIDRVIEIRNATGRRFMVLDMRAVEGDADFAQMQMLEAAAYEYLTGYPKDGDSHLYDLSLIAKEKDLSDRQFVSVLNALYRDETDQD